MLVLTKLLGVGIITAAFRGGMTAPVHAATAVENRKKLNRRSTQLTQEPGVHACMDIMGLASLSHGCEMAEKGGVRLSLHIEEVSFLDGARDYAERGMPRAGIDHH